MIYSIKPENFSKKFEVASCFLEYSGKILLLHRQDNKPQGNTWGIPAGKIGLNEKPLDAIAREIDEEIGLKLSLKEINYFKSFYVRYLEYDFVYHIFHSKQDKQPRIELNLEEHKAFRWVLPKEALEFNLIPDEDLCIKSFYF